MEEGVIGSNHHHPMFPVLSCLHLEDLLEINYLSFPPQGSTFSELSSSIMNTSTGSIFQVPCLGERQNLSPSPNLKQIPHLWGILPYACFLLLPKASYQPPVLSHASSRLLSHPASSNHSFSSMDYTLSLTKAELWPHQASMQNPGKATEVQPTW